MNQLHPDDEVAVLSFSDDVKLQQDFTINRDKNEYGIKKTEGRANVRLSMKRSGLRLKKCSSRSRSARRS